MKFNTVLTLVAFFFTISLYGNTRDSIQEIMPFENPEYTGYRIELIDMVSSSNNDMIKVEFTAINTGRHDLVFGQQVNPPSSLVLLFDESINTNGLVEYAKEIKRVLLQQELSLAPGIISSKLAIEIPANSNQELLEENPKETDILENPRFLKPVEEEKISIKEPEIDDFEKGLATSTIAVPNDSKNENNSSKTANEQFDENACSDLVFESIIIKKKSKNKVILEYTIFNKGEGPASMINNRKDETENMALQAYFSSMDKLTKGSLLIDGSFIEDGLEKTNGKLFPGEKYTSTIKLKIQNMTKFTPYIILEMDPYLTVNECDKKNNRVPIKVGEEGK